MSKEENIVICNNSEYVKNEEILHIDDFIAILENAKTIHGKDLYIALQYQDAGGYYHGYALTTTYTIIKEKDNKILVLDTK